MAEGFHLEFVNLAREREYAEIQGFLARYGLGFEPGALRTLAARDENGVLVGTGSAQGDVLRGIAVDEAWQGQGLTAAILSALLQDMARDGILHYFLFTRPEKAFLFANLGFVEIARAEPYAALLESGLGSVADYCAEIAIQAAHLPEKRAALVINANPFTLGHRALAEKAAAENPGVIVFVVSEDRSLFPFAARFRLVREGLADLPNVIVAPSGKYGVSAATFPAYFTRQQDMAKAQARLDIALFAQSIAPCLGIVTRYAGEEPFSPVTAEYNTAMQELLPHAGITVRIMPRIAVKGGIVSASRVRSLLRNGDWQCLAPMLPPVTLAYLHSPEAEAVLKDASGGQETRIPPSPLRYFFPPEG